VTAWRIGDRFTVVDDDAVHIVGDVIDPDDEGAVTLMDSHGYLFGAWQCTPSQLCDCAAYAGRHSRHLPHEGDQR
jgi:hypothetical protein